MFKRHEFWLGIVALLLLSPLASTETAQAEGWSDDTLRAVAPETARWLSLGFLHY